jgi:hypothetical protein
MMKCRLRGAVGYVLRHEAFPATVSISPLAHSPDALQLDLDLAAFLR